jgi:hypothetical protein
MSLITSQNAWNEAERHARRISALDTAEIIERVLGNDLTELAREMDAAHLPPGTKRAFRYLLKNKPTKAELTESAWSQSVPRNLVFVAIAHEFDNEKDSEAGAIQQSSASLVISRANRNRDVLLLEGSVAGVLNEGSFIRQLRESDRIIGGQSLTWAGYSRMTADVLKENSLFDLALSSHWPAAGIEHLWINLLCQYAFIVEESKPIGTSIPIAYLLVELRNRIALACAADPQLKSKRPVIAMGALHAVGIKEAAVRAGARLEMWVPDPLVPFLGIE